MDYPEIMERLQAMACPENVAGMARFGINTSRAYGISVTNLRKLARGIRRDHVLAERLWASGVHETRIQASLVDEPSAITEEQMDRWAGEFDSWDICDACTHNLFYRTPCAVDKAFEWSRRDEEFVRRAGFALMAALAWKDENLPDELFERFLGAIEVQAGDERNFVKKAVNWALREIGKRNAELNKRAIATAEELRSQSSRSARWIASDALRELTSPSVRLRSARRQTKGSPTSRRPKQGRATSR